MAYFREAVKQGEISTGFQGEMARDAFKGMVDKLYKTKWVIYLKESIAAPDRMIPAPFGSQRICAYTLLRFSGEPKSHGKYGQMSCGGNGQPGGSCGRRGHRIRSGT